MKTLLTIFCLSFFTFYGYGVPGKVYDELCTVNACWKLQPDIDGLHYPETMPTNKQEKIRLHLSLVEEALRYNWCLSSRYNLNIFPA